jgi:hypothetical protein
MGHTDVTMANADTASASNTGWHQLTLDEIVSQFAEEPAVTTIMDGVARIMPSCHTGKSAQCTGIPYPDPLGFIQPSNAVSHGETCTRGAHVTAATAL